MFRSTVIVRRFGSSIRAQQTNQFFNDFATVLKTDLKKSMLAKDNVRKETIKLIRSELKNFEIDTKGQENNEFGIAKVINKMIKTTKGSAEEYKKLNRLDLVSHEEEQIKNLESFLKLLPVSEETEVIKNLENLLIDLKSKGDLPAPNVLIKKLNLEELAQEWKTTPTIIRKNLFLTFRNFK